MNERNVNNNSIAHFALLIGADEMNLQLAPEEADDELDQSNNNGKRGRRRKRDEDDADHDASDASDADNDPADNDASDAENDDPDLKKARSVTDAAAAAAAIHPLMAGLNASSGVAGAGGAAFPYAATLANANVTLDALQNTKMAIAQFAANAMANKVSLLNSIV